MHDVMPSSNSGGSDAEDDADARPTKRQRTSMTTHNVTAVDNEQDIEDESVEEQSSSVKENERNATNVLNSLPKPAEKKQPPAVKGMNIRNCWEVSAFGNWMFFFF